MKKAALYLRVSTLQQTVENQRVPLVALVEGRGFEVARIVEEVEGGTKRRPQLDRLCEDARLGRIQALAFVAIDRLGRSVIDVLQRVEALDRAGCQLLSLRDAWVEGQGASRQLMLSVMSACAALERDLLIERTRAGIARARAQGRLPGRPKASPAALAAGAVRRAEGWSLQRAAAAAGVGRSTLARYLDQL
jgi:DNA invertase Pin-like site-specific DNA recombinase